MATFPDAPLLRLAEGLGVLSDQDADPGDGVASVLIVDDEATLRTSLGVLLEARGYRVELADGGRSALARLVSDPPDVVLLDLVMPDVSGLDVLQALVARALDTRVVVVSGEPSFEHVKLALTQGAADFIKKPFEPEELLSTLARVHGNLQLERRARRAEQRLARSERLHRFMIDHAPDLVYMLDARGRFTFVNRRAETLLGGSRESLVGEHYSILFDPAELELARSVFDEHETGDRAAEEVELRLRPLVPTTGDGVVVEVTATGIYAPGRGAARGAFLGTFGFARDITERKRAQEMVQFQAYHDLLTHLPNRALFRDRLASAVAQAQRDQRRLAVMFIDLDRFKAVNDTFGHAIGDRLLKQVAERLRGCVRKGDTLSRFGGDEFCLLLPVINAPEDAAGVAEKVLERLSVPFALDEHRLFIGATIGIALYPEAGESVEGLIQSADIAMYDIKGRGECRFQFFKPHMSEQFSSLLSLEGELRAGLDRDEIEPYFQPIVNLGSGRIVGVEALARWHHPTRGVVEPLEFISQAEDAGLILEVDRRIQERACRAVAAWRGAGHPELGLTLNLSAVQLRQPDFVDSMLAVFQASSLVPEAVRLEIKESVIMGEMELIAPKLRHLVARGVSIGIDDFGTGYSSLSYLQRFPIDSLKIDRVFVADIRFQDDERGSGTVSVVNAIIHMARGLGMGLIAEGVETVRQRDYLLQHGCALAQGFLFSRPVAADRLAALLERDALPVPEP